MKVRFGKLAHGCIQYQFIIKPFSIFVWRSLATILLMFVRIKPNQTKPNQAILVSAAQFPFFQTIFFFLNFRLMPQYLVGQFIAFYDVPQSIVVDISNQKNFKNGLEYLLKCDSIPYAIQFRVRFVHIHFVPFSFLQISFRLLHTVCIRLNSEIDF